MKINLLEPKVFNRISAGEVVERPASIVKELVENSIDAGAKKIKVEIENGGISRIVVADDGCGIEKEDIKSAFLPHATSKIMTVEDLENIDSLGFRGEALASIASVCHVHFSTRTAGNDIGYAIKIDGGEFGPITEVARSKGTSFICSDLFYNTPVRAKFLRKPKTEESEVTHLMEKFMLSHSDIAFTYYVDGNLVYNTVACSTKDIIYTIYGREVYDNLIEINYEEDGFLLKGFVTKPKLSKSNRTYQSLFVNGRYVENFLVSSAVQGVYESFLMKGRFPIYVLKLILPTGCVDVNVHPSKREVKFENPNKIFGIVRRGVEKALLKADQIANFISDEDKNEHLTEKEVSDEFNREGFNSPLRDIPEPLSSTQGASYRKSVDKIDLSRPIELSPKEVELIKQESRVKPNFEDVKLEEKDVPLNKKGGPLYFDQSQEKFYQEISGSVKDLDKPNHEKSFLSSDINSIHVLGTVLKTYIVAELDDAVYFIDQHAAHERLLYDKLVEEVNKNKAFKQPLLVPYVFSVGAREYQSLESVIDYINQMGFEIVSVGGYIFEVRAIPLSLGEMEIEKFIQLLVAESPALEKKPSEFIKETLAQHACKHAIKGGDLISNEECAYLIDQVRKGVMLCPHGRPICVVKSKREFEKMFKRIV